LNPHPLLVFLAPVPLLALAALAYRSLYPLETVREALERVRAYRELEAQASRGTKRALKRLRAMEAEYRRARGLLLRAMLVKTLLVTAVYVASSLSVVRYAYPAPASLPLVTIAEAGAPYIPAIIVHFAGYVYALVLLRDTLL